MGRLLMFVELDRLRREDASETTMPTERVVCSKCRRVMSVTADEDRWVKVKCRRCGHEMSVIIQRKPASLTSVA